MPGADGNRMRNIEKTLYELQDVNYRELQRRTIPNILPETIIGVRVPVLRKLAKDIFSCGEKEEFLATLPHKYHEENVIHMMLISMEKDFDTCVKELDIFLPYADNWAVTDQTVPKGFKNHHKELLPVIERWLSSDHTYTARYAINMYMREFLKDDFDISYVELISRKRGDDYYLKMMIAWYFAEALVTQYDKVIPYIENKKLEKWTHNKAIQKSIESYRITDEQKKYLRTLKIR